MQARSRLSSNRELQVAAQMMTAQPNSGMSLSEHGTRGNSRQQQRLWNAEQRRWRPTHLETNHALEQK